MGPLFAIVILFELLVIFLVAGIAIFLALKILELRDLVSNSQLRSASFIFSGISVIFLQMIQFGYLFGAEILTKSLFGNIILGLFFAIILGVIIYAYIIYHWHFSNRNTAKFIE
jgi:hypothetical protein